MNFFERLALTYVKLIRLFRIAIIKTLTKTLFVKRSDYKNILINRDGAFGDSIVALPALNIIRQNYPAARIDLLTINNKGITFKDIGIETTLIDNLYSISKFQRKETLKKLKEQQYDLFIQIPQNIGIYKSIRNILLVRFYLNVKSGFGWDSGRVKSFMRLQKKYDQIKTDTQRFVDMLALNNLHGDFSYPLVSKAPDDREVYNLIDNSPSVAFLIGGKLQPKKWPLNHWISLSKLIGDDEKILLVGGEDEKDEACFIQSNTSNTVNLCGKLSIPELRYVLEKTKVVVSLDTGAMHLCDTTDTKLVALFSTRDLSNKWFPVNKNAIVIEKVLPCSFCLKTLCEDNICMKNILPNEVYSKIKDVLLTQ